MDIKDCINSVDYITTEEDEVFYLCSFWKNGRSDAVNHWFKKGTELEAIREYFRNVTGIKDGDLTVLEEYPEIHCVLFKRDAKIEPYVVAENVIKGENGGIQCWKQGHYFQTLADAGHYLFMKMNNYDNEVDYMVKKHIEEDANMNFNEYPQEVTNLTKRELCELADKVIGSEYAWIEFDNEVKEIIGTYFKSKMKN